MNITSSPFWKQILGAIVGAGAALALYGGYTTAAPHLQAWLIAPQTQVDALQPGSARVSYEGISETKYKRFVARSQEIYTRFSADGAPAPLRQNNQIDVPAPTPIDPSTLPPLPLAGTGVSVVRVHTQNSSVSSIMRRRTSIIDQGEKHRIEKTPALPSSGIGVWFSVCLAGLTAGGLVMRRRLHRGLFC